MTRLRSDRSGPRRASDEGGFVLTWFAIFLVVLMAMAGFSIDVWNWWYTGQQNQRAADAAALSGVVYMPGNMGKATTSANEEIVANGYPTSASTIAQGDRANQLKVTVDKRVNNNFVGLLGIKTTDISRSATAEYQGPVPMGSPVNQLGNDPFADQTDVTKAPRFWVNLAGPNATTVSGDRHQAKQCSSSNDNCGGNPNDSTTNNTDYAPEGHVFRVQVRAGHSGNLSIQSYDPGFFYTGDRCENYMFDTGDSRLAELATKDARMSDAAQRYVKGNNQYCAGDQDINNGRTMATTFIVRGPDNTPFDDTDNPVVCTKRFEARNGNTNKLYEWLMDDTPTQPENLMFREYFRQWAEICNITSPQVGEYIVQIRSNATAAEPTVYDPTISDGGHNRFSLRAGSGNVVSGVNGANIGLYSNGRLPIYVNQNDGTQSTNFYLARLEPLNANRTLVLQFFDIGDVSGGSVDLTILPPPDAQVGGSTLTQFSGCEFTRKGQSTEHLTDCSRTGMTSGGFNGKIVTVRIPVPSNYTCNSTDFVNGCWTRVQMDFSSGAKPADTTTWSASIEGDPVRLIR